MLDRIGSVENIPDFLEGVKDGNERLMGFGHRVYKNYDPRARIIKKHLDEVFEVTGTSPLLDIAIELEKRALDDDYFTSRKLYPNVDFYSGLHLRGAAAAGRDVPGHVRDRRAPAAGSPSGWRWSRTPSRRSPARARSTRATASVTYVPVDQR